MPQLDTPIRVVVADDHSLLRDGVTSLLNKVTDIEIVGGATHGHEAVEMFTHLQPDVMLMDLHMPRLGGHDALRSILAMNKSARIIVLSMYTGDVHIRRAFAAGAHGYIFKNAIRFDLVKAIRAVHAGEKCVPSEVAMALANHIRADDLSAREADILQLISEGNSNREVGRVIAVTEETVKAHMTTILAKLKAKDRTHAVAIAIKRGIIEI